MRMPLLRVIGPKASGFRESTAHAIAARFADLKAMGLHVPRKNQAMIAVIAMLIGFLLVTQFQVQRAASYALQTASEEDLGQIVRDLKAETNSLRVEKASLALERFKIERAAFDQKAVLNNAAKRVADLKVLAGSTKVKGPGIRVLVTDEQEILDRYDLTDLVNELRAAGAEAIAINGYRFTAETGFGDRYGQLYAGRKKIAAPYEIRAVGEAETLYQGLVLPGGVRDTLASLEGVSFYITKETDLVIAAADQTKPPKFAEPAK